MQNIHLKLQTPFKIAATLIAIGGVNFLVEKYQLLERVQEKFLTSFSSLSSEKIKLGLRFGLNYTTLYLANRKLYLGNSKSSMILQSFVFARMVPEIKEYILMTRLKQFADDCERKRKELEKELETFTQSVANSEKISNEKTESFKKEIHDFSESIRDYWQEGSLPEYYDMDKPSLHDGSLFLNYTLRKFNTFLEEKYDDEESGTEGQSINNLKEFRFL